MTKGYAVAIPLALWQDPQSNLRVTITDGKAVVRFACWTDEREEADYVGSLTFERVWAARVIRSEFIPYRIEDHQHHSYMLRVTESPWIEELAVTRKATYTEWPRSETTAYEHYVVAGHDEYAEIVARKYRFEREPHE